MWKKHSGRCWDRNRVACVASDRVIHFSMPPGLVDFLKWSSRHFLWTTLHWRRFIFGFQNLPMIRRFEPITSGKEARRLPRCWYFLICFNRYFKKFLDILRHSPYLLRLIQTFVAQSLETRECLTGDIWYVFLLEQYLDYYESWKFHVPVKITFKSWQSYAMWGPFN